MTCWRSRIITLLVTTSYVVLAIFAPDRARALYGVYAGLTIILALVNVILEAKENSHHAENG